MIARIIDTETGERKAIEGDGIALALAVHDISNRRERERGVNLRAIPVAGGERWRPELSEAASTR